MKRESRIVTVSFNENGRERWKLCAQVSGLKMSNEEVDGDKMLSILVVKQDARVMSKVQILDPASKANI